MAFTNGEVSRVQLLVHEIDICKRLASNNLKVRKKGLSSLKKLLNNEKSEEITVEEYNIIWNGLFNYVWMSDTPLVQEADVEIISNLVHTIKSIDSGMLFVRGFFVSITKQWSRISLHRSDKFLMFMRRFLRQILYMLKNHDWNEKQVKSFSSELYSAIQILPLGLAQHLNDIYNEELAKVSEGNLPTTALCLLLECYVDCIVNLKPSMTLINHINANIFSSLVRQVKLFIKQKAAATLDSTDMDTPSCESTIHEEEDGIDDELQENIENMDPRPGNAHVFLPYINFDENALVEFLEKRLNKSHTSGKAKNILSQIIDMFKSITRLRETVNKPVNLIIETTDKGRKRKKQETFGSLIKKSCKKLEAATEDFEIPLKKLRKFNRLTRTVARLDTWEVSESSSACNESKLSVNTSQDWTISDIIVGKKRASSEIKKSLEEPQNVSICKGVPQWIVSHTSQQTHKAETEEDEAPELIPIEEPTLAETAESVEEPENVSISKSASTEWIVSQADEGDSSRGQTAKVTTQETDHVEEEPAKLIAIDEEIVSNEILSPKMDSSEKVNLNEKAELMKKRVSFCEEPKRILFEATTPTLKLVDNSEIVVPKSAVKERPSLLIPKLRYSVVEFSPSKVEKQNENSKRVKVEQATEVTCDSVVQPIWKVLDFEKDIPGREGVDSSESESDPDYNLDEFFKTPPQKRGRKSIRQSLGVTEVKRSARIANKMAAAKLGGTPKK